jgi:coiled-coil domain-containing protein 151
MLNALSKRSNNTLLPP